MLVLYAVEVVEVIASVRWDPRLLDFYAVSVAIPVTMAARVLPKGGELFRPGEQFSLLPHSP